MEHFLNKLVDFATHAGLKLVIAVLVLFLCSKGISLLVRRLKSGKGLAHMDPSVRSFLISALNIVLRLVLIVTVASYLGLPMTSVVTVIGSAGVAIGLAAMGARTLGGETGRALETIVLASSVLYELTRQDRPDSLFLQPAAGPAALPADALRAVPERGGRKCKC